MLLAPGGASAHGLVQREQLPIPQWLFAWAAAAVLVRLVLRARRAVAAAAAGAATRWRPLPGGGRVLGSRAGAGRCAARSASCCSVVTSLAGYVGPGTALDNFAPTFILITFWVGLVFACDRCSATCSARFSPWRAIGRAAAVAGPRPYPERLGRWPAAVGLLVFTWIELVSGWGEDPATLVTAALGYTVLTLAAQVVLGRRGVDAPRRGVRGLLQPVLAHVDLRDARRRASACGRRSAACRGWTRSPGTVGVRDRDDRHRHVRRPQPGPAVEGPRRPSSSTRSTALGISALTAPKIASTVGLLRRRGARRRLLPARDRGRALGRRRARRASGCGAAFIHTLVPIAVVYVAAHYLTFLLFEGQAISYLASDPFGQGWDLFGTADVGDRLLGLLRRRHLVRAGRVRRGRPRRGADARPRPRAGALPATRSSRCARSTGCSA